MTVYPRHPRVIRRTGILPEVLAAQSMIILVGLLVLQLVAVHKGPRQAISLSPAQRATFLELLKKTEEAVAKADAAMEIAPEWADRDEIQQIKTNLRNAVERARAFVKQPHSS